MKMVKYNRSALLIVLFFVALMSGCSFLKQQVRQENRTMPKAYTDRTDTTNSASIAWKDFFHDPNLQQLIDTALRNNQELSIIMAEIEIAKNDIRAKKGEYLPFVGFGAEAGLEKPGEYTRDGAVEQGLHIMENKPFPDPLGNYAFGIYATWEIDIWKKLRNAKKSAVLKYLATVEGKNFMTTRLISEIASAYYELMALDNTLIIIDQNIELQSSALNIVNQQKQAAKVTQLAVNRFEAQLLSTKNLRFEILQRITETENELNFLTGKYPGPVVRSSLTFLTLPVGAIFEGVPLQLFVNRPDIRQAEFELSAAKLDVAVARANFLPSIGISASTGFQAFNPAYLLQPASMLYHVAGEALAPLINRNALKATYFNANAQQLQAVFNYEKTLLNATLEVTNKIAWLRNYSGSFETKKSEVEIRNASINIATNLFNSARADYSEVLFTQEEALEGRIELVDIKLKQLQGVVLLYSSLGGGWK
jgi:outer membrane protein, multidrug efflux system